jgi:phosphatidylserine/phosphatidylglycerophosphate/cardiolipin synthase-like enzyme
MKEMIEQASTAVYICAFEFDSTFVTDDGLSLSTTILGALSRGVHVYIKTSALNLSCRVQYDGLRQMEQQYPAHLHLMLQYSRPSDAQYKVPFGMHWVTTAVRSVGLLYPEDTDYYNSIANNSFNGVHTRFVYNGAELMIGGANYSTKYAGLPRHKYTAMDDKRRIYWWDTALVVDGQCPELAVTLRDVWHDRPTTVPRGCPLVLNNRTFYNLLLDGIKRSEQSIYIEHQYFFSGGGIGQNRIADALVERITRAVHRRKPFRVTLVTNVKFRDDSGFGYDIQQRLVHYCLDQLLARVEHVAGIQRARDYLSIYVIAPESHTTIHTKVVGFDQRHVLLGSGNLFDASFHPEGHEEMMWYVRDDPAVYRQVCSPLHDATTGPTLQRITRHSLANVHRPRLWTVLLHPSLYRVQQLPVLSKLILATTLVQMPLHAPASGYLSEEVCRYLLGSNTIQHTRTENDHGQE